jgi:hypothetical protein
MYRDYSSWNILTGSGNNNKFLRMYASDSGSRISNMISAIHCDGSGVADALHLSNESLDSPTWSVAYTARDAGVYTYRMFDMATTNALALSSLQAWEHWEFYLALPSSVSMADGVFTIFKNGITVGRAINAGFFQADSNNDKRWYTIGMASGLRTTSGYEYIDEVYIDNTQAHVFISDSPSVSWPDQGSTHHSEIQVPTFWSDSSITMTFNQGSFANDKTVYLYVVDADGKISNGYPLTTGKAGPPPNPPTGLRITSN